MPNIFPLQLLLATCAGWVNRQQGQAIDYLIEENRPEEGDTDRLHKRGRS